MKYTEYEETKKHGTDEFPFQYYYVDKNHAQYIMPLHWHRELEIIRVLDGELCLWINNERHELSKNDVAFVEGGVLHRGEPENCKYDCVVFDPLFVSGQRNSRLSELIRLFCSGHAGLSTQCFSANETANRIIDTARDAHPFYELKLASLVCELAEIFYTDGAMCLEHTYKRSNHRRAMITVLIDKIERDYAEKITITDLAGLVGVNEKYLCRFFKEFTGYTPTDYINRIRVDRACYEMRFNHRNVTEAAYECGFNEISYFSKCFKRYKGVSPGKYR